MDKWADYVITAVRRGPGVAEISKIQQHEDRGDALGDPVIVDKNEVAKNIRKGRSYMTLYKVSETDWRPGDAVTTIKINGKSYLRIDRNKVDSDNLGTLPEITP